MKKSQLIKIIKEEITKVISEQSVVQQANARPKMSGTGVFQPRSHFYDRFDDGAAMRMGRMNGNPAFEITIFAGKNQSLPDPGAKVKADSFTIGEREAIEIPAKLLQVDRPEEQIKAYLIKNLKLPSLGDQEKAGIVFRLVTSDNAFLAQKMLRSSKPSNNMSFPTSSLDKL